MHRGSVCRKALIGFRTFWNLGMDVTFCIREGIMIIDGEVIPLIAPKGSTKICTLTDEEMQIPDRYAHYHKGR